MSPSEIAEWHEGMAQWVGNADFHTQAAATIRAQAETLKLAEGMMAEANCSLFGSQSFFGDDKMHISRAIEALKLESGNRWRALKIATEALERIEKMRVHCSWASQQGDMADRASQALARIKEVGDG